MGRGGGAASAAAMRVRTRLCVYGAGVLRMRHVRNVLPQGAARDAREARHCTPTAAASPARSDPSGARAALGARRDAARAEQGATASLASGGVARRWASELGAGSVSGVGRRSFPRPGGHRPCVRTQSIAARPALRAEHAGRVRSDRRTCVRDPRCGSRAARRCARLGTRPHRPAPASARGPRQRHTPAPAQRCIHGFFRTFVRKAGESFAGTKVLRRRMTTAFVMLIFHPYRIHAVRPSSPADRV